MSIRFIGEIGNNHNQNLDRTIDLIIAAKECGFQAVKFQMLDQRLYRNPTMKNEMANTTLPAAFLSSIRNVCDDLGLEFHCTPFHPDFVSLLDKYVDAFKIGSYEILWLDLIAKCAATGKPLGISTGGASMAEVHAAFDTARRAGLSSHKIVTYHCVPFYPAQTSEANLNRMHLFGAMPNVWGSCSVGYSDHTKDPAVIFAAAAHAAKPQEIEMHLDLEDGEGRESSYGHCWKPNLAKSVIDLVRRGREALKNDGLDNKYQTMRAARTDPSDGARPMLVTHYDMAKGEK